METGSAIPESAHTYAAYFRTQECNGKLPVPTLDRLYLQFHLTEKLQDQTVLTASNDFEDGEFGNPSLLRMWI